MKKDDKQFDHAWFKQVLKRRGISMRAAAAKFGMEHVSFWRMLQGDRRWATSELEHFAITFDVPVEEVLAHAGVKLSGTEVRNVALVGQVLLGDRMDVNLDRPLDRVPGPADLEVGAIAVILRTAGIPSLKAMDGWLLYCSRKPAPPAADCLDRLCLLELAGGAGPILGHVRRGYRKGTHAVHPLDGSAEVSSASIEWAMPCVWIRP